MIQLTSPSSSEFNELATQYFIVQHMPDVMRKETLNVGVVVQKGDSRAALFLGEREPAGEIDGRALRSVGDAQTYRMWVRHWRKALAKLDWKNRFFSKPVDTYNFIPGGEVTDTGTDTADQIAYYLYSMLVSGGGLREAISVDEGVDDAAELRRDLHAELRKRKITASFSGVRHPVYESRDVRGDTMWHPIAFYQELGKESWAFEPLNLATNRRQHVRERAGYIAFVFGDIRKRRRHERKEVNTTAVVTVTDEYREESHVKYALKVIQNNAEIIYTSDAGKLNEFLNHREMVAHAA